MVLHGGQKPRLSCLIFSASMHTNMPSVKQAVGTDLWQRVMEMWMFILPAYTTHFSIQFFFFFNLGYMPTYRDATVWRGRKSSCWRLLPWRRTFIVLKGFIFKDFKGTLSKCEQRVKVITWEQLCISSKRLFCSSADPCSSSAAVTSYRHTVGSITQTDYPTVCKPKVHDGSYRAKIKRSPGL